MVVLVYPLFSDNFYVRNPTDVETEYLWQFDLLRIFRIDDSKTKGIHNLFVSQLHKLHTGSMQNMKHVAQQYCFF